MNFMQRTMAVASFLGVAFGQELPDGKGKEAVQKICSNCHDVTTVTGARRTRKGWEQNVDDMVTRGAEGSEQELQAVVDYLTKFYGKTNVNAATAKEMEDSLGLSAKEAEAIIAYREQNGNIKNFEQLKQVPGVNGDALQTKRAQIAFTQ